MIGIVTGATRVAGVVGYPVRHSLSPLIHNAWLVATGLDGVYVAFAPEPGRFAALIEGFRGAAVVGLNVTAPFKEQALVVADHASGRALDAGSANLLLFRDDGRIEADNTDGEGLLAAFASQAPGHDLASNPVLILGAGGAARGAASAFIHAGSPHVLIINRDRSRGEALAMSLGANVEAPSPARLKDLLGSLGAVVNATPAGLEAAKAFGINVASLAPRAVVMDMVYRPVITPLLAAAQARGLTTVDGLEMLIGQARPSFEAMFERPAPALDVRALAMAS